MKNKLLLGSALLASAFMLNVPSASAMPAVPYDSRTSAFAQGNEDFGTTSSSAFGPMTHSHASVNGFELHSYSEVSDNYIIPNTAFAATVEGPPVHTSGRAGFRQQFQVVDAGTATLRFDWDGVLYSNGTYSAGYNFRASAESGMGTLGSVSDDDAIGGGMASVNLFHEINLVFTPDQIGNIFDVFASLSTFAGDNILQTRLVRAPFEALIADPRAAYADFDNTAIFSFTSQGAQGGLAITPSAVPVPAAVWLLGSALLGLIGIRRKSAA